jgi:hypothetical protein
MAASHAKNSVSELDFSPKTGINGGNLSSGAVTLTVTLYGSSPSAADGVLLAGVSLLAGSLGGLELAGC